MEGGPLPDIILINGKPRNMLGPLAGCTCLHSAKGWAHAEKKL